MRKDSFFCYMALLLSGPELAHAAELPPIMKCKVSGYGGCSGDVCVGGGRKDPSIKLTVSRPSHSLLLNGISGTIDGGNGNPYADVTHHVRWNWGLIAFETYRLSQPQPGRVFLTLNSGGSELEFHCLGSLHAK